MSSQLIPMRYDLEHLQKYLEKQQQKYDNALNSMNDVRKSCVAYVLEFTQTMCVNSGMQGSPII